ncbi:MAG: hypothetical protein ACXVA9_10000 [Bdellovibrionales bacterium]
MRLIRFITLILLSSGWNLHAAGLKVDWYQPFHFSPPLANHSSVVLYGHTEKGVSVSIDKSLVITGNPALMESFAGLQKSDELQATSDDRGYFQLSITLPQGLVQIPVSFLYEEKTVTYVISLQVEKNKISISVPTVKDDTYMAETRDKLRKFVQKKYGLGLPLASNLKGLWLSFGLGVSYQILSQNLNQDTALSFTSSEFPSINARATWNQPKWLANFNYVYQPGKVSKVSAPFTLSNSKYTWSSYTFEGGYNWLNDYFGERSRFTWLLGLQQHQMPFFQINYGNEIANQTLNLNTLSFGPMFTLEMGKKFLLEVVMRYQQNLFASHVGTQDIHVTPKMAFDGSLGTLYKMNERDFLGLFWFGQWHRYDVKFRNQVDQIENTSSQNLFYSSMDLRYIRRF